MAMRSVMQHQFSQIPRADIPRSSFNRSHGYKTTFDSGYLVPFYVDEALPGDTFSFHCSLFSRLATPIVPIMDNMFMETFFFAVPIRLIWDNWVRFQGEQRDPGDSTDFLVPQIKSPPGGWQVGTLSDYFALPTEVDNLSVSSFWHRAYNLIYNEWFRDQNLQESLPVPRDDGPDSDDDFKLVRRGKRHDYFTSALPWPQKGPGIELPLGATASIGFRDPTMGETTLFVQENPNHYPRFKNLFYTGTPPIENVSSQYFLSTSDNSTPNKLISAFPYPPGSSSASVPLAEGEPLRFAGSWSGLQARLRQADLNLLQADLSTAIGPTINSLRQAFQLQKLLERDARGGTRYTEILRAHFGVVSPDSRLQRPEYLGGSSTRINVNPVQQTSSTDNVSPQGNLAAFGVAGDIFHGFTKSFVEHCVLIGLVNVRADLTYQQGIQRMFSRQTRYDFYMPVLAHLGEQEILNKEIYAQGNSVLNNAGYPVDDEIFGYQERWAEYRYFPSQITGKFRSNYAQSLDVWHLSQKFNNLPKLNAEFIEDNPPIKRVIAVPSEPEFIFDCYVSLRCARPMPIYSVPGLVDHF